MAEVGRTVHDEKSYEEVAFEATIVFAQYMEKGMYLEEHLTTFKEIVADMETLEVKYEEEDLRLMLVCSLPNSYANFKDTILYSRDTLTLNEVYGALFSKEKMKRLIVRPEA